MVFKFSKKEVAELKNIMETAEPGSLVSYKELLKDSNLMKFRIVPMDGSLEVIINEDYSVEYLQTYGRYVGLLSSQAKALIETVRLLTMETDYVTSKYTKSEPEKDEDTDLTWLN